MRIEFKNKVAKLFLNDHEHSSFLVNERKEDSKSGSIALWVDIGTEGYFKGFKITKRE